jgi:dolichyl-phosphate mannosyltransferase polypeptide 3
MMMTRGGRVALLFLVFTILYILAFFQVLRVPLVEDKIVQQILPVVGPSLVYPCQANCFNLSYPFSLHRCPDFGTNVVTSNCVKCQVPWWLLVSFGSYSLWCLGWGLFTFRDCPEAYAELLEVGESLILYLSQDTSSCLSLTSTSGLWPFRSFPPLICLPMSLHFRYLALIKASLSDLLRRECAHILSTPRAGFFTRYSPHDHLADYGFFAQDITQAKNELRAKGVTVD